MNESLLFPFNSLNHSIQEYEFFHWFNFVTFLTFSMIFDNFWWLIFPTSHFIGLSNLQLGEFWKLGLWSFNVMKHSLLEVLNTLLFIPKSSTILLWVLFTFFTFWSVTFLYSLLTSFSSRFLSNSSPVWQSSPSQSGLGVDFVFPPSQVTSNK